MAIYEQTVRRKMLLERDKRIAELTQIAQDTQRRFHELGKVRLEMCEAKDARIAELEAALGNIVAKTGPPALGMAARIISEIHCMAKAALEKKP